MRFAFSQVSHAIVENPSSSAIQTPVAPCYRGFLLSGCGLWKLITIGSGRHLCAINGTIVDVHKTLRLVLLEFNMTGPRNLAPGIQRLESPTRYRVRIYFEGKQHSIGTFDTIRDAEAALVIAKSEKARGIFIPPALRRKEIRDDAKRRRIEAVTISEWADDWLKRLADAGRSPGT